MKMFALFLIKLYRKYVSPFKKPCCRFIPTCSTYALEAVKRYGLLRGGFMAFCRILRCNPFFKGGYDPVPEKEKWFKKEK